MTERDDRQDTLSDIGDQARDVQIYDFTSPNRLSRDQIRKIEYLHSAFIRRASMSLAGMLRGFVNVRIDSVDEVGYAKFIESVPSPGAAFTFSAEPLEGLGILDIDLKMGFALIDRLLGGKGYPIDRLRELTSIEQTIAHRVAETILKELESAWNSVSHLSMEIVSFANTHDFFQVYAGNTSIVVIQLSLETENCRGTVRIGYPYPMFEPLLRDIAKTQAFVTKKQPDKDALMQLMRIVPVELSARLPCSMVRMGDLVSIQAGDVLVLDTNADEEIEIFAEGKKVFQGRPGRFRNRLAIKISEIIEDGGCENDS